MKRIAESELVDWMERAARKPLIVRGARQVGKTYLVEAFGRAHFSSVLTLNLEQREDMHALFTRLEARRIVQELSLYFNQPIEPGRTLLFLDEIQACPKAIACLRYFQEELPDLHVIAAGSLLDFALREFKHSMPVGRIEYLHLYPMTFGEFLRAMGEESIARHLAAYHIGDDLGDAVHGKLRDLLRSYYFVGGMPSAVAAYVERRDLLEVQRIQALISTTLQDDFAKYGTRAQQRNMRQVMRYVPRNIGRKLRYVNISRDARSAELRTALELLELSRVVSLVRHTSANGIPLGAEASETHFKPLLMDIGLCNNLCGLSLPDDSGLLTVQEGGLAEQFVGQELHAAGLAFLEHPLFYWHREQKNANAEVDYLLAHEDHIVPVEVRAGASGRLKSLQVFLAEKKRDLAVRLNMDTPSIGSFAAALGGKDGTRKPAYTLLSLPLYLAGELDRLVREHFAKRC
ncbi:MAG: ATP-binding protein [Kiritimatiellae bacterium]|nr:ATP-binding protein [Kiritimatiellia bacterium]